MGFRSFARLAAEQAPRLDDPGPVQPADLHHDLLEQAIYRLMPQLHTLVGAWEAYLRIGGFPQAVSSYVDFGRLLYDRSKTNREIDFVGRDLGDIAIESKYVTAVGGAPQDARSARPDGKASSPPAQKSILTILISWQSRQPSSPGSSTADPPQCPISSRQTKGVNTLSGKLQVTSVRFRLMTYSPHAR